MKASDLWYNNVIKRWEGDTGLRPVSEDTGGLTRHGVTIGLWKEKGAKILGKPPTPAALLTLTWPEAQKISKVGFWDKWKINTIRNPALRPHVADAYWLGGGLRSLGYKSISELNRDLFATPGKLYKKRMAYLRSLSNWAPNAKGWLNRNNSVLATARKINRKRILIISGVTIAVAGGGYLAYRHYKNK